MTIEQARQHWHKGIAVGKLKVVHAEGKEPRLVLDSTVCGVNPKRNIPERISLPMASDVRLAFLPEDTHASFIGASFDFKAAHKQVQVHPSEHGLLLFRYADTLYQYRVCDFGRKRVPLLRAEVQALRAGVSCGQNWPCWVLPAGAHCPEGQPERPPDCFMCDWLDAAKLRVLAAFNCAYMRKLVII